MNAARPSINDIAARAGVSKSTVSRVLGGYGSSSSRAAQRVLAAAAELEYRPNSVARSMKTGRTQTLALIVADIENPFFATLTRGFTDAARRGGYDVLVSNTDENIELEIDAVRVMLEKRVDAVAVAPASRRTFDHLSVSAMKGVPLVLVDRAIPELPYDTVLVDSRGAAQAATEMLIARGHRRIAILTGASREEVASARNRYSAMKTPLRDRVNGYRAALRKAGIEYTADYLAVGDFRRIAGATLAAELLALPHPPTAIFALDSVLAAGAFEALMTAGLSLPADLSLLSFDDTDWATLVQPRLSVVAQPVYQIGELAAERLIGRLAGDASRGRAFTLPATLIERESVATIAA